MEQHVTHVKKSFGFLKTTAIGGLIFLLPLIVIGILVGQIAPIVLAVDNVLSIYIDTTDPAGVALLFALSIAIVVLMCFAAGMIARWSIGQKLSRFMEKNLIILFPRYAIYREQLKGSIGGEDNKPELIPVLIRFDDVTRLAFEAERTEGSLVSIFLPKDRTVNGTFASISPVGNSRAVGFGSLLRACRVLTRLVNGRKR